MYGRQEDATTGVELRDYGRRPHRSEHESAWKNPRDDDRDPQPFNPDMDRYAVGTNVVPEQRKPS